MADENGTIESPEDVLLAAVMAPDAQDLEARDPNKLDPPQDLDEDETKGDGEDRTEAKDGEKPDAKADAKAEDAPEEDEVEVPGADGEEPKRYKLADLVARAQEYERFEAQKGEIIERVEREAVQQQTQGLRQIEQFAKQTAVHIEAALQVLAMPQPPNAEAMLNPHSPQYDPDGYHRQFAQYQRAVGAYQQAQGVAGELIEKAKQAAAQATEARDMAELQRLKRVWPEFEREDTFNKFISDMGKAYGFTPKELDDVLVDHRQALVARDALAFRAMRASSGDVKAKVEAKAPKLVRSKQEAKGSSAQARDQKGQFASGALAELRKTNSDDAAAAYFTGLVKAGRI